MAPSRRAIIVGHANGVHDPAIAVVDDDVLVAEAFERHTQCKRSHDNLLLFYSGRALKATLREYGGWPVRHADVVAISSWRFGEGAGEAAATPTGEAAADHAITGGSWPRDRIFDHQLVWTLGGYPPYHISPAAAETLGLDLDIRLTRRSGVPHHLAHAATAVYTSPFDRCVVMVLDGAGEDASTSFYLFHDNQFEFLHRCGLSHSLGILYATVTSLCGFNPIEGEEWKVMGLAAYGRPCDPIYQYFRERIEVRGLDVRLDDELVIGSPGAFRGLGAATGGFRSPSDPIEHAADLAHNFQRAFEDTVVALASEAAALRLSPNLAYAGGCALNSAANGKIIGQSGFERLHVPSAPADDGNALGVALYEKYAVRGEPRSAELLTPFLGSRVDAGTLDRVRGLGGGDWREYSTDEALCDRIAALLAAGAIVGWVQGRAEFGPRALGGRSILAAPFPAGMKDRINERVKFREEYRPLAPAILHEHGPMYFEHYQESPYMERTLVVRSEMRDRIPAAVHRDGSARLQTVMADWNPRFHRLLASFHRLTGVPVLVNTSYNVAGKPIVHTIEDAVTVFHTTGLDVLVIDRWVLQKTGVG